MTESVTQEKSNLENERTNENKIIDPISDENSVICETCGKGYNGVLGLNIHISKEHKEIWNSNIASRYQQNNEETNLSNDKTSESWKNDPKNRRTILENCNANFQTILQNFSIY